MASIINLTYNVPIPADHDWLLYTDIIIVLLWHKMNNTARFFERTLCLLFAMLRVNNNVTNFY